MRTLFTLLVVIILVIGGYFAYEYIKEKPPAFLIKWVTKTEPPPPLPSGEEAPLQVPPGFRATIYARDIPGARAMTRDQKGTMLVSLTSEGKIVALPDLDGDRKSDQAITVLENLRQPHGILMHCPDTGNVSADQDACKLYVAETGAVKTYNYDADTYTARNPQTIATLPVGSGHFTRTLLLHPDGKRLLVSVGSSCNVCEERDARRATIQQINLATNEMTPFATGLRNSVFMAIHPVTGDIWATDNGRDLIGDDIPPDEINVIREGAWYGWPWFYGKNIEDMDFNPNSRPSFAKEAIPSHIDLQAHSAALGLTFVPEEGWPEDMWHDVLVAYHGSWNRSTPTGYKVVRFDLAPDGSVRSTLPIDFVTGFLAGNDPDSAIGRPVDVRAEPGGILYISDDRAGAIYTITATSPAQ